MSEARENAERIGRGLVGPDYREYGEREADAGKILGLVAVADEIAKLREALTPGEGDREARLQTVIGNLDTELSQARTVLDWYARSGQSDGGERARRFLEEPRSPAPVESEEA